MPLRRSVDAAEKAVLAANEAFYDAFRNRDMAAMQSVWSARTLVVCVHPGTDSVEGIDKVMTSWSSILRHPKAPRVTCSRSRVQVLGTTAVVTCLEGIASESPRLVATNVFVLEEGQWRLAHHHAAPLSLEAPRAAARHRAPPRVLN